MDLDLLRRINNVVGKAARGSGLTGEASRCGLGSPGKGALLYVGRRSAEPNIQTAVRRGSGRIAGGDLEGDQMFVASGKKRD